MKNMKLIKIIIILFVGLILGIGSGSVVYAVDEHGSEQVEEHADNVEHGQDTPGGSEETHGGEHGGGEGNGHGGGEHHIWWTFPGHELLLSIISCIYFAVFIIVIGRLFGTDLEGHH